MAHSLFSPSAAHRWINCPGSLAAEKDYPQSSSVYADEGTAAHTIASECLTSGDDAIVHLGRVVRVEREPEYVGPEFRDFTVDEDMAANIQVYLNLVRGFVAQGYQLLIEQRVWYTKALGTVEPQGGTADSILINFETAHIVTVDLKFGKGQRVEVKDNEQLLGYLVAACETYESLGPFDQYTAIICQPRIDNIVAQDYTAEQLAAFSKRMRSASIAAAVGLECHAVKTPIPDDLFNPGPKTCYWCKHITCAARERLIAKEVFDDFEVMAEPEKAAVRPAPALPSADRIGRVWEYIVPLVAKWAEDVNAEVLRQVNAGMVVTGSDDLPMKLVEGRRGHRKWANEELAETALTQVLPDPNEAYEPRNLITPAAAEKLLKGKEHKDARERLLGTKDAASEYIVQPPGRPRVALGSDPKPAYTQATLADFDEV